MTDSTGGARVFVALGSNLGDREQTLSSALDALARHPSVTVVRVSPWLENPAVGGPPGQPPFLNGVAELRCALAPEALLALLLEVELAHGRRRGVVGAARTLDLDLLLFGDEERSTEQLWLPHPRMLERSFVLQPLAQVAPGLRLPQTGRTPVEELARLGVADRDPGGDREATATSR